MEQIKLTNKQHKDLIKSLLKRIREFFNVVFNPHKPLRGDDLNSYLLSQTESEAEKETLEELLDENATFHAKRREYNESGKSLDDWYEDEIEKTIKMNFPDSTPSDIDKVKGAIANQIDEDIVIATNALDLFIDATDEDREEKI